MALAAVMPHNPLLPMALDPDVPASLAELRALPFRYVAALEVLWKARIAAREEQALTRAHRAAVEHFQRAARGY